MKKANRARARIKLWGIQTDDKGFVRGNSCLAVPFLPKILNPASRNLALLVRDFCRFPLKITANISTPTPFVFTVSSPHGVVPWDRATGFKSLSHCPRARHRFPPSSPASPSSNPFSSSGFSKWPGRIVIVYESELEPPISILESRRSASSRARPSLRLAPAYSPARPPGSRA